MQFVVCEEYTGPRPTLEDFGVRRRHRPSTGLCDAAVPCGRGAAGGARRTRASRPQPDADLRGRAQRRRSKLADGTIDTSLIYRTDAARVYTKFEYLPLPDPTVGAVTYQSISLQETPVAQEFQSWIATSTDAEAILVKLGLRARSGPRS